MVTLNSIFASNMIMQAGKPVRFFGDGDGQVAITFNNITKEAEARGGWLLEFDPVDYGGPYDITVKLDSLYFTLKNVYFGDVYILGGQSNMQFKLWESNEPKELYEENENARLYTVDRMELGEPFSSRDGWIPLSLENVPRVSAIGYYVAKGLADDNRKIGLIACYQGASVIQSWLPRSVALQPKFEIENCFADHEWYPIWNDDGVLFENMTKRILPYSVNGVLWYQGESNASDNEADLYLEFLKELVSSWRRSFCDPALPFYIVQLADHTPRAGYAWSKIQQMQAEAEAKIDFVKTIVCRDVCEADDIHPKSKKILSERIIKAIKG
ncbi:MAG: hypothetical protein IJ309_00630 [Clostridia bacterium]|nr:hypothetical protein [Clostridia bacterium]